MELKTIMELRDNRVHISAVMLMGIVQQLQSKHSSAYIAEIHSYYISARTKERTEDMVGYTEGGIYAMLTRLNERGYVEIEKHGIFNSYRLSDTGWAIVESINI